MTPWHTGVRSIVVAFVVAAALAGARERVAAQDDVTVVYLVRHAEKADDGTDDPPLTKQGAERARALVHVLADAGIDRVHSTHFVRARETAAPLAKHLGLNVETYDPQDLEGFARALQARPGRHLVSGHSNTTPALVGFLGGAPGSEIYESTEYDRLYVVTLRPGAPAVTTLLRFGEPSPVP